MAGKKKTLKLVLLQDFSNIFLFPGACSPSDLPAGYMKKATLCMKYFKSACSMITSSIENAC